ncbi:MAG: hypothetical protein JST05_05345 [Acidobacteria bacterium]|nr:hypothetical protein [Acidobacteriota bacterium]
MSEPLSKRSRTALIVLALLLAAGLGLRIAFGGGAGDEDDDAPKAPAATLDKGEDGKPVLQLAKGQAEALGLETESVSEGSSADALSVHGVVLDPLTFLDLDAKRKAATAALRAAQAADSAAQAELKRVEALHGTDHDASDKALQDAERAAADAAAQRATAEGEARKAQAAWTQTGLDSVDGLADFHRVVARLDLPLGAPAPAPMPKTLQATAAGVDHAFTVRVLGLAPGGSPLTGGLALLAVAPGAGLRPGVPVDASIPGAKHTRVIVPRAALLWSGGEARVFVQVGEGRFIPRSVQVDGETANGVALEGGLSRGDRVASQGALALEGEYARLAEGAEIGAGGV